LGWVSRVAWKKKKGDSPRLVKVGGPALGYWAVLWERGKKKTWGNQVGWATGLEGGTERSGKHGVGNKQEWERFSGAAGEGCGPSMTVSGEITGWVLGFQPWADFGCRAESGPVHVYCFWQFKTVIDDVRGGAPWWVKAFWRLDGGRPSYTFVVACLETGGPVAIKSAHPEKKRSRASPPLGPLLERGMAGRWASKFHREGPRNRRAGGELRRPHRPRTDSGRAAGHFQGGPVFGFFIDFFSPHPCRGKSWGFISPAHLIGLTLGRFSRFGKGR